MFYRRLHQQHLILIEQIVASRQIVVLQDLQWLHLIYYIQFVLLANNWVAYCDVVNSILITKLPNVTTSVLTHYM